MAERKQRLRRRFRWGRTLALAPDRDGRFSLNSESIRFGKQRIDETEELSSRRASPHAYDQRFLIDTGASICSVRSETMAEVHSLLGEETSEQCLSLIREYQRELAKCEQPVFGARQHPDEVPLLILGPYVVGKVFTAFSLDTAPEDGARRGRWSLELAGVPVFVADCHVGDITLTCAEGAALSCLGTPFLELLRLVVNPGAKPTVLCQPD